jgi:recombination associated protein RdgC
MTNVWMRNISAFALREWAELTLAELQENLSTQQFRGISSLEKEHRGFTNVFDQENLVCKVADALWVQVKTEQKKIQGAVLKRVLAERVEEIEKRELRKVGRKEKKELKDLVSDELLATTIPVQSITTAVIDPTQGYILIGTASAKTAEAVVNLLVQALPNLTATTLNLDQAVPGKIAEILLAEEEGEFVADSSLVLKGNTAPAATVRFAKCNLSEPEVVAHLSKGLRPTSVELTWNDRISFVLTDPLTVRRLNYIGLIQEDIDALADVDAQTQLNGLLTLQIGELRELFGALFAWLGLPSEELQAPAEEPSV